MNAVDPAFRAPVPAAGTPRIVSPADMAEWDRKVVGFRDAGFFHSQAWARVLAEAYGFRPAYLDSCDGGDAGLILPVMEVSNWISRPRGVSLPFTDECGVLCDDPVARKGVFASVGRLAAARSWASWEYRGGREALGEVPASQSFFGHALALGGTSEEMFARLDGNARTSVRKAVQNGVTVDFFTDFNSLKVFYDQLCGTRRRQGLPPQPFGFFRAVHRHVLSAGHGTVAIASHAGRPVASAVFFHFGRSVIYKFAASEFESRHLQANHLVLWRAIERYAALGLERLDFGRTSRANKGLRHFKLAWRPREEVIDYVKYDFRRARFVDCEQERTTGWHNRVFRLLPAPLAKIAGAILYRHFA